MAKITRVFLSGTVGKLICYERNGKPCVRSKPEKVTQTAATKRAAGNFARAMPIAKYLRWGLEPVLPEAKGRYTEYRLNTAVAQWLSSVAPRGKKGEADLSSLSSLELCKDAQLSVRLRRCRLKVDWGTDGTVTLRLPAMTPAEHIQAPAWTTQVHWTIAVAGSRIKKTEETDSYTMSFDMAYSNERLPARNIELPFRLAPGSINAVAVSIQYTTVNKGKKKRITDAVWLPAAIVDAWHEA